VDGRAEPFAVAVIRAWIEPGTDGSLRVRVMRRTTGGVAGDTIGVTSNIREAGRIVERWLHEFVDATAAASPGYVPPLPGGGRVRAGRRSLPGVPRAAGPIDRDDQRQGSTEAGSDQDPGR
jgi:hypothetical protein